MRPRGTYIRYRTYPSGKRVRLVIAPNGRILEEIPVGQSKVRRTRTGRRLARLRRRIGLS